MKKVSPGIILRYYRAFLKFVGKKFYLYICIVFISTGFDGVGIALFVPLIQQISSSGSGDNRMSAFMRALFAFFGLPYTIEVTLGSIVLIFTLKTIMRIFAGSYQYHLGAQVTRNVRTHITGLWRRMSFKYYIEKNIGHLLNVSTVEAASTTRAFLYFAWLFPRVLLILVYITFVITINAWLALITACIGGGIFLLLRTITKKSHKVSTAISQENSNTSSTLMQILSHFKYLRATAGFPLLSRQLNSIFKKYAGLEARAGLLQSISFAMPEFTAAMFLSVMLYIYVVVLGRDPATVIVSLFFLYRLMTEIMLLQTQWQGFITSCGGVDSVNNLIQELEANQDPAVSAAYPGFNNHISLQNVNFSYGEHDILFDIDLTIPKNSMIGIVGESGSGKSTLVDIITGVQKPSSGRVIVDGTALGEFDGDQYQEHIGYVTQENVMFNGDIRSNVSLWSAGEDDNEGNNKVLQALQDAYCIDFLNENREGLNTPIGDRGIKLSGGQRQRVSIARELFKKPDLLLMDEATSALDSDSEINIHRSIHALKGKMTVILIAHRLSTIKECDMIYVLHKGRITESGTYEELKNRPGSRFNHLVELQKL